ncbi:MAG: Rab family GTPase [Candidatus Helarchaeota archaeon]
MEQKTNYTWKICVIGDPSVGKTTLMLRYTEQRFEQLYIPTVGCQVSQKFVSLSDKNIKLNIWDIAGQSKFAAFRKIFYEGAFGYILVFDTTNKQTLVNSLTWNKDYQKMNKSKVKIGLLVGNKVDLESNLEVTKEEAEKYAKKMSLDYVETSAKTGQNVDLMFQTIVQKILEKIKKK